MKKLCLLIGLCLFTNLFAIDKKCPSFEEMTTKSNINQKELDSFERTLIYNGDLQTYNSYIWLLKTLRKEAKLTDDLNLYINLKDYKFMKERGTLKDFAIIFNNIDLLRAKKEKANKEFDDKIEFYSESMSQRLQLIRFKQSDWCDKNLLKF